MLFTDIEGSTRLLKQLGERYGELLAEHRRLLREAVDAHGGREMETQGDAFFFAFARAGMPSRRRSRPSGRSPRTSGPTGSSAGCGWASTPASRRSGDEGYHGIGLHRGARIAAAAHGGQVLLSNATAELVQDDLPAGVGLARPRRPAAEGHRRGPSASTSSSRTACRRSSHRCEQSPATRPRRRRLAVVAAAGVAAVVAAAAAVIIGTRDGSAPAASAAAVSADSVGIFKSRDRPADRPDLGRSIAERGRRRRRLDLGRERRRAQRLAGRPGQAGGDPDDPGRQRPGRDRLRRRLRLGHERPRRHRLEDRPADGHASSTRSRSETALPAWPSDARYVWVANSSDGTVTRIDLRTGKPLAPIAVGQSADGVAVGGGSVWVTSAASGTRDAGSTRDRERRRNRRDRQRRGRGRGRRRTRSGSRTASTAPSRASIPTTDACRADDPGRRRPERASRSPAARSG